MGFIIAIDGPTASGKGTLAKKLGIALGFAVLDTGLLYRAVGVALARAGHAMSDEAAAVTIAKTLHGNPIMDDDDIRTAQAGQLASQVSTLPAVRQALLELQRTFAKAEPGAVLDGRDIGTVICPDAPLKLYVTASAEARALRRHKELTGRGQEISYEAVLADIKARDDRDMNRAIAPLKPAADAIIVDTSSMDAERALSVAFSLVMDKLAKMDFPARTN